MPTTVNGIGTTYFGKKNLEQYEGVCESCNNHTTLSDYETGYFFCIIFIPIIPLGRKMILGECPICTRHRVMPLHEWERIKEESITEGVDSLRDNMDDPEKALELLGTYSAFKQYDKAEGLAKAISSNFADNYDAMLTVGGWYEQRKMKAEAEECFDRCLELDYDCPQSKHIRAITHIENGELDEGRELAAELFALSAAEYPGGMFMLIDAFQKAGRPADAYEIYKAVLEGIPELVEDGDFKKDVRKLEKELGVEESIVPKAGFFERIFG